MVFLATHNSRAGLLIIHMRNRNLREGNWLLKGAKQVSSKAGWHPQASDRTQVPPSMLGWSSLSELPSQSFKTGRGAVLKDV